MPSSDCRLLLKIALGNERVTLCFTSPFGGVDWDLCTIEKTIGQPIVGISFPKAPGFFTRLSFRCTNGLRGYELLTYVESDFEPKQSVAVYSCTDRKGRQRRFVHSESIHETTFFLVKLEDYDQVCIQISEADSISRGEQDPPVAAVK